MSFSGSPLVTLSPLQHPLPNTAMPPMPISEGAFRGHMVSVVQMIGRFAVITLLAVTTLHFYCSRRGISLTSIIMNFYRTYLTKISNQ